MKRERSEVVMGVCSKWVCCMGRGIMLEKEKGERGLDQE